MTTVFGNQEQTHSAAPRRARSARLSSIALQMGLIALTVVAIEVLSGGTESDPEAELTQLATLAAFQLIAQIAILKRRFGTILIPPVVFSVLLSLFTSGWLILRAFRVAEAPNDVVARMATTSITAAATFYLFAFSFFGLGVVISGSFRQDGSVTGLELGTMTGPKTEREECRRQALTKVGAACCALGFIPFTASNIINIQIVATQGYSAYYDPGTRTTVPLAGLGYLLITGLIFLAVAAPLRPARWALWSLCGIAIIRLVAGDRGEGFIYLLTALMISRTVLGGERPARTRRFSLWIYGAFAVVTIPLVGGLRQAYGGNGGFSLRASIFEQNLLVTSLRTVGGTIYPLIAVQELVPSSQEFLGGTSFLSGPFRVVPAPLRPSWSKEVVNASPASWLQDRMGLSYGPGFTPFAEAYINFGFVGGCITLFLIGLAAASLLRTPARGNSLRASFVFTIFALCGFAVRGSSNFVVPFVLRYSAIPVLLAAVVASSELARRRRLAKGG